jgi:MFS family permease
MTIAAERSSVAGLVACVLGPLGAAFLVSNFYRSVNAVLSPYLIADLHLTARSLGLITSVYFFTSAVFQAPLGLFMDRYGPRRVQGALMLLATVGVLMFALSRDIGVLVAGRAIMGIGAAGALMTCFQAVVLWFPPARWPVLNGWIMAAGGLGGLMASAPAELVLHVTDWHGLMLGAASVSVLVAIAIYAIVPERRRDGPPESFGEQVRGLGKIYGDRLFWRLSPMLATVAGSNLAFGGLWAGPWLKDVAGLSPDGIALNLLFFTTLITAGFAVSGTIAGWLLSRGVTFMQMIGFGFLVSLLAQTPLLLPTGAGRWVVMGAIGSFSGLAALAYPVLNGHFPAGMSGRVNTAVNLFFFCGAFAMQYAVGAIIDLFPQGTSGRYPAVAYQTAFGAMLLVELVSWLWFLVPVRARPAAEPAR